MLAGVEDVPVAFLCFLCFLAGLGASVEVVDGVSAAVGAADFARALDVQRANAAETVRITGHKPTE